MGIDPGKAAIVVMDFQPLIMASIEASDALAAHVGGAVAVLRAAGGAVATVRVAFTADDIDGFPPHSAMGARMRSAGEKVAPDAPATQIVASIGAIDDDIAVRKTRVGPFLTTDLDAQLKARGITTIALAGIHSSGCVLTGVREAHDLDYEVIVLGDGCADPDPAVHAFLIEKIFPKQARVMTIAEFGAEIGAGDA